MCASILVLRTINAGMAGFTLNLLTYSPVRFLRVEFRQIILQSFCKSYLYSFIFNHCIPQLRMDKAPVKVKGTPVPFEGFTPPLNIGV
jgi:hypothetical protein